MIDLGIKGFFDDIGGMFSAPSVLGIDMGTVSMKALEVSKKGNIMTIDNYGIMETREYLSRGNAAIQTSSLKISEREAVPLLKTLIREMKPATRNVIASIPAFAVFFVTIEMPAISDAEAEKAIQFQAKQYIPVPVNEVSIEWVRVGEYQNERGTPMHRYFLTAVPNTLIKKYTAIFQSAGLRLVSLEVETQAIVRALLDNTRPITLIMDMGGESTGFMVVEGGSLKKASQTDYAGVTLTQALSRALDISSKRAEDLKRRKGLLGSGGEIELSTSLLPFLDVIIQECERVQRDFERTSGKKIEDLIVVGGGANLLGLERYLKSRVRMNVRSPDALWRFQHPIEMEPTLHTLNKDFATAAGLALRRFI